MYRIIGSVIIIAIMATLFLLKNPQEETLSSVDSSGSAAPSESTDLFKNINAGQ